MLISESNKFNIRNRKWSYSTLYNETKFHYFIVTGARNLISRDEVPINNS